MTKIYIGMSADLLHPGHLNIIHEARKLLEAKGGGEVIVGLLTDSAIVSHKRLPALTYEQRKNVLESIKGVSEVIIQEEWSYITNLKKLKPNYIIHGDDWKSNYLQKILD